MNLPAGQRRILHGIEQQLRSSDRRLTSLFGTFTRLTQDEDVPHLEQLRPRPLRRVAQHAWLRAALFCAIAMAALMCAVVIGAGGRGTQSCGPMTSLQQAGLAARCSGNPAGSPAP